jgi:dihydroxyacetone kinase-like protein
MADSFWTALRAAADAVEAAREPLCALDAVNGDGDHGVTMTIGARAVRTTLDRLPDDATPSAMLRAVAMGAGTMGGAIGPIYARGLLAAAKAIDRDSAAGMGGVAMLTAAVADAEQAVIAIGRAKPGDKTILDAMEPMRRSLEAAAHDSASIPAALAAARAAARDGAEATAGMVATVGRAARFGDKSRGGVDPGAASFALMVEAAIDSVLGSA